MAGILANVRSFQKRQGRNWGNVAKNRENRQQKQQEPKPTATDMFAQTQFIECLLLQYVLYQILYIH